MGKKDVKRRLNGFSLPIVGGGAQWETVESTRASAHRVLTFLADRRVLFNPYWQEQAGECAASVLDVRRKLTDEIGQLHDGKDLVPHLTTMQGACRQFLDLNRSSIRGDSITWKRGWRHGRQEQEASGPEAVSR